MNSVHGLARQALALLDDPAPPAPKLKKLAEADGVETPVGSVTPAWLMQRPLLHPCPLAFLYPVRYILRHETRAIPWAPLKCLRDFPEDARHDAGYPLDKVQSGEQPDDFKPMQSIGKGVEEIRVRDDTGAYRLVYIARLAEAVMCFMPSPKRPKPRPAGTLPLPKNALPN
jgi:phage-related protein